MVNEVCDMNGRESWDYEDKNDWPLTWRAQVFVEAFIWKAIPQSGSSWEKSASMELLPDNRNTKEIKVI